MDTGFQVPSSLGPLSMFGVLSELGKAPFVASGIVLSKYGTVNNSLVCSILYDNLVENWDTCFRMYRGNASLSHILMTIIVSGDTPAKYIAIAAPEWRDCAPISMGPKPNPHLPRIWTAAHNFIRIPVEVIVNLFPFLSMKVFT